MKYHCIQSSCFQIRDADHLPPLDKLDKTGPHNLSDTELLTVFASPKTQDKIRDNLIEQNGLRGLIDNLKYSSLNKTTRLRF